MPGERIDDLPPNATLKLVQIRRRLRTTPARDARNDGGRGCGFTGHLKKPPLDGTS
jgi:hypothetical protein